MLGKIKEYFTAKPKGNFWMHAFILLFLFRYVAPSMLIYLTFLQIGLLAPEADLQPAIESAKIKAAEGLMEPMIAMQELGQKIATNNPLIAKILAYALANFIWVVWVGLLFLVINMSRFGISWIINRYNTVINKKEKEDGNQEYT
jgi:hypothetical protein